MKCKIKKSLDCFLQDIPNAIKCTKPDIRDFIKEKLANGHVLIGGNLECMANFLFQYNPNWIQDFKYAQPICANTKYGMRFFNIVENNNKFREIFNKFYNYDIEELETMIYCNFRDVIANQCVTEIVAINPEFKGNAKDKIDELLDNFF